MIYEFKENDIEIIEEDLYIRSLDLTITNSEELYKSLKKIYQTDMTTVTCIKCENDFQLSRDGFSNYGTIAETWIGLEIKCPYCDYRETI